ncbi:unnamed protein product [Dibothriocephalus latus]|uniref:Uncharacterized protein n=1 Tax=Dibothriocephalus latus TaxID=60516 RepID=A0A3P6TG30_DIBLA|nr:unnamed protein product [Dibothriocephalus latus]
MGRLQGHNPWHIVIGKNRARLTVLWNALICSDPVTPSIYGHGYDHVKAVLGPPLERVPQTALPVNLLRLLPSAHAPVCILHSGQAAQLPVADLTVTTATPTHFGHRVTRDRKRTRPTVNFLHPIFLNLCTDYIIPPT